MHILIKLLVNAAGVFVFGALLRGVKVKGFGTAILVAIVLALLNTFIKPIITFFTFPFILLTLGLFILVINTIIVMITDWLIDGLEIKNFWWALIFSILMSLLNIILFEEAGLRRQVLKPVMRYQSGEYKPWQAAGF